MKSERKRIQIGGLEVPECLLDRDFALGLLRTYLERDDTNRFAYSGAAFDLQPHFNSEASANHIDDTDLIALTYLSIRVRGHHALEITRYRKDEIHDLLTEIPIDIRIGDPRASALLQPDAAAWRLWQLLRNVGKGRREYAFGPVAAAKLLARKRPHLIPISDSRTASAFARANAGQDKRWWDDVHAAALDPNPPDGLSQSFWQYLGALRTEADATHLPVLRVLDILGWMCISHTV